MQRRRPPKRAPGASSSDERKWFELMTVDQLLAIQATVRERIAKDTRTLAALKVVLFNKQQENKS